MREVERRALDWQQTSPGDGIDLRPGVPTDALCIGVLATQVFLDTYATNGIRPDLALEVLTIYSPEAFASRLASKDTRFIVAECQGHLVAFAEYSRRQSCPTVTVPSQFQLVRLYVQQPFQRSGIGGRLLHRVEEAAWSAEEQAVWLTAWKGNAQAIAFYMKQGYASCGRIDHTVEGQVYENILYAKMRPLQGS